MTTVLRLRALYRWAALLGKHFPLLSACQVFGLALWSIGIVLARSASLHAVVLALSCWLPVAWCKPHNLLKRLHEWYLEAHAKKGAGTGGTGKHRRDWEPRTTAAYLLRWLVQGWPHRQLVVVLDPTNFQDRFHVLAISVLYRRCAVPVLWTVVPGGQPEAWPPHWERMVRQLAALLPPGWQVLVLADRGLYSPRLFRCPVRLGWHPFLRLRAQGFFRPHGSHRWRDLAQLRLGHDQPHAWRAELFKNDAGRRRCTLLAYHGSGYAEPWLIATDLSPTTARASWYGLRGWIEQGFKRLKGEGWKLHRTRITSCARLERLWLAVAVAPLWVLQVGGAAEAAGDAQEQHPDGGPPVGAGPQLPDLDRAPAARAQRGGGAPAATPPRIWAVFARGWCLLRDALAVGVVLLGSWYPEAWPDHPRGGLPPTPEGPAAATGTGRATSPGAADNRTINTDKHFDSS
jgi:hypothetical protein